MKSDLPVVEDEAEVDEGEGGVGVEELAEGEREEEEGADEIS